MRGRGRGGGSLCLGPLLLSPSFPLAEAQAASETGLSNRGAGGYTRPPARDTSADSSRAATTVRAHASDRVVLVQGEGGRQYSPPRAVHLDVTVVSNSKGRWSWAVGVGTQHYSIPVLGDVFAQRGHSAGTAPIITVIIQVTALKTTHLRNHAQSIQNSKIQTSDACHGSQGPKFFPL